MKRRDFLLLSAFSPLIAKAAITETNDIFLSKTDMVTLHNLSNRLSRLQRFVGFGNFNFISYDNALYFARNYSKIGAFTKSEKDLIEKLFYITPSEFGFYGEKTVDQLTKVIDKKEIYKVPYSGHYIFKGKPLNDYNRIVKDVGDSVILTSGVRNVVKQLTLYINKLKQHNGNLTKSSSIIAPPAFTYHAVSDFDIGKKGWGNKNFTAHFARTKEFAKIQKLNYIDIRYTINNKDGVRFEPWHVKVI